MLDNLKLKKLLNSLNSDRIVLRNPINLYFDNVCHEFKIIYKDNRNSWNFQDIYYNKWRINELNSNQIDIVYNYLINEYKNAL